MADAEADGGTSRDGQKRRRRVAGGKRTVAVGLVERFDALPFEGPTRSMPSTHVGSTVTTLTRPSGDVVRRYPAPKSASACSKRSRSTAMLMDSP